MKANSEKTKQSKKATRRVLAGVLCGASVLSLVLSLVMPPISQAIANDAQTDSAEETVMGGGYSTESTDVDNTNNGDTENQNSDDAKGGETDPTNGVEQNQAEDQPEGELQVEDNEPADDNAVKAAAEGGQTGAASGEIDSADTLKTKLESASGTANFELTKDIDTKTIIQLGQDGSNITLDLKGHKIKHMSQRQPLFNITGGATLTIKDTDPNKPSESVDDGKQLNDQDQTLDPGQNFDPNNYGQEAKLVYDTDGIPSSLTYYVTQSSPRKTDTTKTTETLYKHSVDIKGAIVACDGTDGLRLINLYKGGTFNKGGTFKLESGVITQQENTQQNNNRVDSLVYAENGSTVNMSGGYVCGATSRSQGAGIELKDEGTTLDLTGGVIADNYAPNGGGVYSNGSSVSISKNAVISGNATLNGESDQPGYGGGIMARGGSVAVSGGYITNNRMSKFCGTDGSGNHGGGGLAADYGAKVTISGGQITGNYSKEAGGGVYVTDQWRDGSRKEMTWLNITGGIIASNVSFRSEGAGIRVGQKVDAMIGDTPDNNDTPGSKVYITNNRCMSRFDWGGGGVFVQGDSKIADNAGRLFVYNSYISSNTAGGYGGGVAVCPTGKTLVTNTKGTAIFGNSSARDEYDGDDHPDHPNDSDKKHAYNSMENSGNDVLPHLSGGGIGDTDKTEDRDAYKSDKFREYGHADFFLAARDHNTPVAVVTGKMLGGGDAQYSGSIEREKAITIPADGAVGVKNSIGLTSGVMSRVTAGDEAAIKARDDAQNEATTFITGNYSWDHGGGIMSNGDLYLGQPVDAYVYPSLKLKATKALKNQQTKESMTLDTNQFPFSFSVYRKDSDGALTPSWDGETFNSGGCRQVKSAPNNADGNITFDLSNDLSNELSKQPLAGDTGKIRYSYYLVEDAGNIPGVDYDHAVYEINVTVEYNKTLLMTVPIKNDSNSTKDLNVYNYTIDNVSVTKNPGGSANSQDYVRLDDDGYYSIADSGRGSTFTNKYTPSVSWTPKATKVVEGGEMKAFALQLAKDSEFKSIIGTAVTAGNDKGQTLSFKDVTDKNKTVELKYSLSDIRNNPDPGDSTGGPSKTFTYYVCEKNEESTYPHYKFDQSVYKLTVVAKDDDTGITTKVTYTQIKDADGKPIDEAAPVEYNDGSDATKPVSIPTFTNTYSTSLPLSGMSGVTLTYLAGAVVLCAAAAWMHIRRKANAKGGKRRE